MTRFRLDVGEVVVESEAEELRTPAGQRVLQEAFRELGRLLAATPFARWEDHHQLYLDTLELEPIASDELLGPQGAHRLAERMYARLEGGWS